MWLATAATSSHAPRRGVLDVLTDPLARGALLGGTAALIWGLYLALARQGVTQGLAPADIAVFRYVTAGLVMAPWLVKAGALDLAGIGWRRGLVLATLAGPLFILLGVGGYLFAPLAHGAVVQPAVVTLATMLLAALVLGDRPDRARATGAAIVVGGVVLVAGPGLFASGSTLAGDAMFAAAGLCWAGFTVLARRWRVPPLASTAVVSVLGGLAMLPVLAWNGFAHYAAFPVSTLLVQIAVQGVLTGVVSVLAFNAAALALGPSRAAIFPALVPVVAMLVGIPIAGEWPTPTQWAGLAVVTVGLLTILGVIRLAAARR
jgi:drug/metabolite transporter (DMT)-like permease